MTKNHAFDFTKATMYLSEGTCVYLDTGPISQSVSHFSAVEKSYLEQLCDNMFSVFRYVPIGINTASLFRFLLESGLPERYWQTKRKNSFTQKHQQKMIDDQVMADWGDLYREYKKQKKYNETVRAMLDRIRYKEKIEGADGSMITEVSYSLSPDYNRRFNTNNENVIGLYGNLRRSLKVPKGYVMVGADFPQIDGRGALNTYFKTEEMINIDEYTEDSYLVFRELARQIHHYHDKYLYEKNERGSIESQKLLEKISFHDSSVQEFPDSSLSKRYIQGYCS